jgi:hypothetical protein
VPNIHEIQFKPGKAAYLLQTDYRNCRLEGETDTGNAAGDQFTYKLSGFIRHQRGEVDLLRNKLRARRVHVVATYHDSAQRFVPLMRLSMNDNSGQRRNEVSGYQLQGTARLRTPAPWLAGTFDVIGGPYVPPVTPPTGGSGVTPVTITTSANTYNYTIPSGKLLTAWEVVSDSAQSVSVGVTAFGAELAGPQDLLAGQVWVNTANVLPSTTAQTIYFSGLIGTNTIRLWLLG